MGINWNNYRILTSKTGFNGPIDLQEAAEDTCQFEDEEHQVACMDVLAEIMRLQPIHSRQAAALAIVCAHASTRP